MWWPRVPAAVTAPQTVTGSRSRPGPARVGPNWSNGQIFIAVMPWARRSAASSPARPGQPGVEVGVFAVADAGVVDRGCGRGCGRRAGRRSAGRRSGRGGPRARRRARRWRASRRPSAPQKFTSANMFCQWFSMSRGSRPSEERREDVVDDRGDGARQVVGLAEAGEAGVGVDADPEVVGERLAGGGVRLCPSACGQRLEPDGLDLGDLHRRLLVAGCIRACLLLAIRRTESGRTPFKPPGLGFAGEGLIAAEHRQQPLVGAADMRLDRRRRAPRRRGGGRRRGGWRGRGASCRDSRRAGRRGAAGRPSPASAAPSQAR